jgi:hypothetical protein
MTKEARILEIRIGESGGVALPFNPLKFGIRALALLASPWNMPRFARATECLPLTLTLSLSTCIPPCRSAEWNSAVSQSETLRGVGNGRRVGPIRRSAEYHSAKQQIDNLRYDRAPADTLNTYLPQGEGTGGVCLVFSRWSLGKLRRGCDREPVYYSPSPQWRGTG